MGSDPRVKSMPEMGPFEEVEPPPTQAQSEINRYASWYTWSAGFKVVCDEWRLLSKWLPEPRLIHVAGGQPYDYTFAIPDGYRVDLTLQLELERTARALLDLRLRERIMLLTGLLEPHLDGMALHFLFAYLRNMMVEIEKDQMAALYTPLAATGKLQREFMLHADLYLPIYLFNVFEDVPADGSGASIFLPFPILKDLLDDTDQMPEHVKARIIRCLTQTHSTDLYEEFYNLLHGPEHCWTEILERKMFTKQLGIRLNRGQGYIINDRYWLHGREAPTGGVSRKRLHRLIFGRSESDRSQSF